MLTSLDMHLSVSKFCVEDSERETVWYLWMLFSCEQKIRVNGLKKKCRTWPRIAWWHGEATILIVSVSLLFCVMSKLRKKAGRALDNSFSYISMQKKISWIWSRTLPLHCCPLPFFLCNPFCHSTRGLRHTHGKEPCHFITIASFTATAYGNSILKNVI